MVKHVLTLEEALTQAASHVAAGDWEVAETYYRTILKRVPDSREADQGLKRVLESSARSRSEPAPTFTLARPVSEPGAEQFQALNALFEAGRFAEAETIARRFVAIHPGNATLHTVLGVSLWRQGKPDEAIASYKTSLELQPGNPETYNNIGTAYFNQSKFAEAATNFEHALSIKPDHALILFNLGNALWNLNRLAEAAAVFKRGMALKPDAVEYHMALIRVLTVSGDVDAANDWAATLGLPLMQRLSQKEQFNGMADLISVFYQFLKIQDTEEQYAQFCVPAMELFYKTVRNAKSLAPATPLTLRTSTTKKRKVAFFAEAISQLAHTRNLFNYVRSVARRPDLDIEPVLYFAAAESEKVITQYHDEGVRTYQIPPGKTVEKMGRWLREHLRANDIDVCVILGTISGIFIFLLGLRVAPVQIWWSQKYHGLKVDNVDGYLTLGGFEPHRDIQGRSWRCVPGLFGPEITAPAGAAERAEAARVRATLLSAPFTQIAGVVGREEKLDNDEYWDCVAQVLKKHPDMLFIWSGRSERQTISQRIAARGLTARCRFVGWVNTKVYVNVIDIYLDSFPFPGGHTLIEAIMADKPVVSLVTKEARRIGIPIFAEPWLKNDGGAALRQYKFDPIFTGPAGEDLRPFVADTKTYVDRALTLLDDPAFRARWTAAGRQFVERYLTDMNRPADMLNMHIMEVIRDRERVLGGADRTT